MPIRQKSILIILVQIMVMLFLVPPAFSKSPFDVVKEFVKAGKSADFKKLTELSCKDFGPYLTVSDAQKLDLSDLGLIQEIVRQEKSEADPQNFYLVIARVGALGQIGFGSFYVFYTDNGWKVYISGNIIKKYPVDKLSISKSALRFYYSNKINLDTALKLAKNIVNSEPNSSEAYLELGHVYYLKRLRNEAISEYAKALKLGKQNVEKHVPQEVLIDAWKALLKTPDKETRYYAAEMLYARGDKLSIPVLIEKWKDEFEKSEYGREQAAKKLAQIGGKEVVPFLSKALEENKEVRTIARLLGEIGDNRAVPSLIKALHDEHRAIEDKIPIIEALGKIGDRRAESDLKIILEKRLCSRKFIMDILKIIVDSLNKVTGEDWANSFSEEGKTFYPADILLWMGVFHDPNILLDSQKEDAKMAIEERLDSTSPNYGKLKQWIFERWAKKGASYNCQKASIKNKDELELIFKVENRFEYLDTASLILKKVVNKWKIVDIKEGMVKEPRLEKIDIYGYDRTTQKAGTRGRYPLTLYSKESAVKFSRDLVPSAEWKFSYSITNEQLCFEVKDLRIEKGSRGWPKDDIGHQREIGFKVTLKNATFEDSSITKNLVLHEYEVLPKSQYIENIKKCFNVIPVVEN